MTNNDDYYNGKILLLSHTHTGFLPRPGDGGEVH